MVLTPGEHVEDAISGCTAVAMRRAASFGRAPVIHDLTLGLHPVGLPAGAPADLVAAREHTVPGRVPPLPGAAHHRRLRPGSTLRLTPDEVADRLAEWSTLLDCPKVTEQPLVRFPVHLGDSD